MSDKKVVRALCNEIKRAIRIYQHQPEGVFPYTEDSHTYVLSPEEEAKLSINATIDNIEFPEVE